jgi:biofilm PGA synthesis N-glycosyltransferase PgaC
MAAYVIVTAARNEEANLERLFGCVLAQTAQPLAWIIVSDGSTDGTDELVRRQAAASPWVRFLRRDKPAAESRRIEKVAPGKVGAIETALASCGGLAYDFLAILDADVTIGPTYYERVLERFGSDPGLGIAGGMVWNILPDGSTARGGFKNPDAVGGPIQMFRRRCYEDIGGYKPFGHEDGRACADARRRGWAVRSFPDVRADHHVPVMGYASTIASMVPTDFYLGEMHYVMRMPLWFEAVMALRECFQRPFVLAGAALLAGHFWAMLRLKRKAPREVPFWTNQREYAGLILSKARRTLGRPKAGG